MIEDRRGVIRRAMLFAIGMALGKLDAVSAAGGMLTVDLNQWSVVMFKYGKQEIAVPTQEIFDALK